MIRTIIVDDEPLVRLALRDALESEPDIEIIAEHADGVEALRATHELRPDLLLLDVQMPGLTGMEVAAALDMDHAPAIVFVTAWSEHAVKAFELHSVDYVLKPFDPARVRTAIARARERLGRRATPAASVDARLDAIVRLLDERPAQAPTAYLERFVASLAGRLRVIPIEDVEWIEAADNYARVHTTTGSALVRATMKSLDSRLDPRRFVRVHRSVIVSIAAVRELRPLDSGDYQVVLASGRTVTMSRTFRDEVLGRLGRGG
jgi:two-component system LytT family response regulator